MTSLPSNSKASVADPSTMPPTPADAATLRASILKITTGAKIVEAAVDWIQNVLVKIPSGDAAAVRVVAGFRVQRPSGSLKSIKVYSRGNAVETTFSIERVGLFGGNNPVLQVLAHEKPHDPFVTSFQKALSQELTIASVPIMNLKGIWGSICIGFKQSDLTFESAERILRVVVRVVNDQLSKHEIPQAQAILNTAPRSILPVDEFLGNLDLLLACSPKGAPGAGIIAFSLKAKTSDDAAAIKRMIRQVAQRAIDISRSLDTVTIVGDDTVLLVLPRADQAVCANVISRLQNKLKATIPAAASGGFTSTTLDATANSSMELFESLASKSRAAAAPISIY
ncbi:MAG: hypothetical protein ACKVS6_02025 [Planctomycetota bacterium]